MTLLKLILKKKKTQDINQKVKRGNISSLKSCNIHIIGIVVSHRPYNSNQPCQRNQIWFQI